jgi:hypothetical protein
MLSELITYLITSCPPYVRKMGYLYQAVALRGRYRRRRSSWQPHLENSRRFIIKSAESCENRDKVVVLGSGLLLDLPLDELSSLFKEVILVDVIHLPEVNKKISGYRNVRLLQCDVTGVSEKLFENVKRGIKELPLSVPFIPELDSRAGLVISLNIMSQLSAIPHDYVLKKNFVLDEDAIEKWCDQICEAHYSALKELPYDVCLIADYEFARKDKEGKIVENGSTIGAISLPKPDSSWIWEIAPIGEESSLSKELLVGAWRMKNS